ncbi:neuronal acetylcholine receptor subunit beta-3-like isoform X3 [Stylophora pistillata]|nr:neuronal acetylcholine receptor subunit beta-3-like isoform X3 [Stylophora pistillata]XP_022801085.1 neuronal acetylcholine receptor subunit beta-3-like isoform X3 [Stylophora pistillata]
MQSAEYRLRKALLSSYDKMIRPVLRPKDVVDVTFDVQFQALSAVDNKQQVITVDTVITQKWDNPYLRWDPTTYDNITVILVDPKEVWVPDIVLENNADDEVVQAGHLEKFRSWVVLNSGGNNLWLSPATFKSTCKLNVQFFPFDKQECNMLFRSLTADRTLLNIYTKEIDSDDPDEELRLTTSNGYWSLRSIEVKTEDITKHFRIFSEVKVSFSIGRKPLFFVLFSIVPCMIIGMLVLVSFFIPVESGERIGLCATILLAVSVYLLVVTDQLPEQSDTLPLIGVYYITIMFEIGLALAATVLVLRVHHATSEPPRILTCITAINRLGCFRSTQKPRRREVPRSPVIINSRITAENNTNKGERNDNLELEDVKKQIPDTLSRVRNSTTSGMSIIHVEDEEEANQKMWREIARALDRMFFWLFLALFVSSSIAIYSQAGRLSSLN